MSKEAYYFSHDANARNDEKILMLRAEHGMEGYGIYWALLEMMFESADTKLFHNKIRGMAVSYNIDITLLQSVINVAITEGLFVSDGEKFWSESLIRRKDKFHDSKRKRSEAGKKGMEKRWGNKQKDNNVITNDNDVITKNNKGKESKGKESKEVIISSPNEEEFDPYIFLFDYYNQKGIIQHKSLTAAMKKEIKARLKDYELQQLVQVIDNYAIVQNGEEYLWDYKYGLADLMRDKDVRKFIDDAAPLVNFKKKNNFANKSAAKQTNFQDLARGLLDEQNRGIENNANGINSLPKL